MLRAHRDSSTLMIYYLFYYLMDGRPVGHARGGEAGSRQRNAKTGRGRGSFCIPPAPGRSGLAPRPVRLSPIAPAGRDPAFPPLGSSARQSFSFGHKQRCNIHPSILDTPRTGRTYITRTRKHIFCSRTTTYNTTLSLLPTRSPLQFRTRSQGSCHGTPRIRVSSQQAIRANANKTAIS